MNEIVVLLGAQLDLQTWFERQQTAERADRLEREIQVAYQQLAQFPRSSRSFDGKFRRHLLNGFPYGLFYAVEGRRVMIHALLDTRQDPETIRRRLGL